MSETWWVEEADLDKAQRDVIDLPKDGSFLVKGPPGSGKSNLLLLRANFLTLSQKSNIAIIVFNTTLREFMRSGASRYQFDSEKIITRGQFFHRVFQELGRPIDYESKSLGEQRLELATQLKADVKSGKLPVLHQAILLDEAQDYFPEEIEVFRQLCSDLFAVADSRQKIYSGTDPLPTLRSVVDREIQLTHHYRNGLNICRLADQIGTVMSGGYEAIAPTSLYREPIIPSRFGVFQGNIAEQAAKIAEALTLQRRTFPDSLLGVVCPRVAEVKEIADHLRSHGLGPELTVQTAEDGYLPLDETRPIWVSTIHSAKGLEFRTLHVAGLDFISKFRGEQKRLAFTAITRAKTSLDLYYEQRLPDYLIGAIDAMRPPAKPPKVGDTFGKR